MLLPARYPRERSRSVTGESGRHVQSDDLRRDAHDAHIEGRNGSLNSARSRRPRTTRNISISLLTQTVKPCRSYILIFPHAGEDNSKRRARATRPRLAQLNQRLGVAERQPASGTAKALVTDEGDTPDQPRYDRVESPNEIGTVPIGCNPSTGLICLRNSGATCSPTSPSAAP